MKSSGARPMLEAGQSERAVSGCQDGAKDET